MISPVDFKALIDELVANLPTLNKGIVVVEEDHLAAMIRGITLAEFPIIVGVLPDAKSSGQNIDSFQWNNSMMFFILQHVNENNRTKDLEIETYQKTFDILNEIIGYIFVRGDSKPCHNLRDIDWNSIDVQPEYNYFSCDGYSITFNARTR